jgi:hypothetical protein
LIAFGDTDRVYLTDEVCDRDIGRGQLLTVTRVAADPLEGCRVALLGDQVLRMLRDRVEGIVVHLAAENNGDLIVQQVDHRADQPRFGLTALAQEDDVLPGEDRVLELRDHGFFEAEDAGEDVLTLAHLVDKIAPHLLLDGLDLVTGAAQLTESGGFCCHCGRFLPVTRSPRHALSLCCAVQAAQSL